MKMKRLGYGIIIMSALVLLNACAGITIQDNPGASFQVNTWVNQTPPLKVGDLLLAMVKADRNCYLHVYYLSGSGIIRQIFPDTRMAANWVSGGIEHIIPPSGGNYNLSLKSPPMQETIMAVATLEAVRLLPADRIDYAGVIPVVNMTEDEFNAAIKKSLDRLLPTAWAVDMTHFTYAP